MNLVQEARRPFATGSKVDGDIIWKVRPANYPGVTVHVADLTQVATTLIASRAMWGEKKTGLFREVAGRTLFLLNDALKVEYGWGIEGLTEHVILRGALHTRPKNVAELMRCNTTYTAQRWHRIPSGDSWIAQPLAGTDVNIDALRRAKAPLLWDGCSASGSTLVGVLRWLKVNTLVDLRRVVVFCPIMGDIAFRRLCVAARELGVQLTVICFGIYHVVPHGWLEKWETDIVIPADNTMGDLLIPERQIHAYSGVYQPKNWRGPCIVGDFGDSTANDPKEPKRTLSCLSGYLDSTIEEWPEFCNASIPDTLFRDRDDMRARIATL